MQLGQTFDPRDQWQRARRLEIYRYAQEKGISEIVEAMPKDLMVKRLKALGIPAPSVPPRTIVRSGPRSGDTSPTSHHYNGPAVTPAMETVEVETSDVLERDWKQEAQKPVEPVFAVATATITELRQECKRRGIKMARTDNMTTLREKLNG